MRPHIVIRVNIVHSQSVRPSVYSRWQRNVTEACLYYRHSNWSIRFVLLTKIRWPGFYGAECEVTAASETSKRCSKCLWAMGFTKRRPSIHPSGPSILSSNFEIIKRNPWRIHHKLFCLSCPGTRSYNIFHLARGVYRSNREGHWKLNQFRISLH